MSSSTSAGIPLFAAEGTSGSRLVTAALGALVDQRKGRAAVRWASRLIRNLSVFELVVAGDLGDRGSRLDKVTDILTRQPRVRITWGNHDVSWMGACLGHRALIATVLRVSLRYLRIAQLEEGYGISIAPVEKLARTVYKDDPSTRFRALTWCVLVLVLPACSGGTEESGSKLKGAQSTDYRVHFNRGLELSDHLRVWPTYSYVLVSGVCLSIAQPMRQALIANTVSPGVRKRLRHQLAEHHR